MRIHDCIVIYLRHLHSLGRSSATIKGTRYNLGDFHRFLQAEEIENLEDLTEEAIRLYQEDLAYRVTAKGRAMGLRSQAQLLSTVKGFTRSMREKDYLLHDPADRIQLPRKPKRLPRVIMDLEEVRQLLAAINTRTNTGYRNKLVLEILYDTAIRRKEVAGLKLVDLDLNGGYVRILGKGDKERVVPMSARVCGLINNYLQFIRPAFLGSVRDEGYLILNRWGGRCTPSAIYQMVRSCCREAGITKNVSTHTFRHTCATHMLKNGAPVRHLQEMLGHESLESTQIYTRVTISDLKEIHAKHHPGESM